MYTRTYTFAERGPDGVAGRRYCHLSKTKRGSSKFNFRLRMRITENAASGLGLNFAD